MAAQQRSVHKRANSKESNSKATKTHIKVKMSDNNASTHKHSHTDRLDSSAIKTCPLPSFPTSPLSPAINQLKKTASECGFNALRPALCLILSAVTVALSLRLCYCHDQVY